MLPLNSANTKKLSLIKNFLKEDNTKINHHKYPQTMEADHFHTIRSKNIAN